MSETLLNKVIRTTELREGGGLLEPRQADQFIDYMWDATVLGNQVNTVRMTRDIQEVDRIGIGERLLRGATEAVDDGINIGVAFARISLTATKLRMDWEISRDSLEDNIEGDALEDHIARMISNQTGQDLEDLAINGDTRLSRDPLLKMLNGWGKIGRRMGHVVDAAAPAVRTTNPDGTVADPTLNRAVFNAAIKAMPRRYMGQRGGMKFFTGASAMQDYLYTISQSNDPLTQAQATNLVQNGGVQASGGAGWTINVASFGVAIQEVPLMNEQRAGDYTGATGDHGEVWLTFPKNLVWGVRRDIEVFREFKPKKDAIEFTLYTKVATEVENKDAFVVVKNVKVND